MTTKIVTVAVVPDDLAEAWLQHLRNFDTAHNGCHFQVLALTGNSPEEIERALKNIDPPFAEVSVQKKH